MGKEIYTEVCWSRIKGIPYPVKFLYEKDKFGYPNRALNTEDNQLFPIYINTFFLDKNEAWESLKKLSLAFIESSGRKIKQIKKDLLEAQERAGCDCEFYNEVIKNFENDKDIK